MMIGEFSHIVYFGKGPVAEFTGHYYDPSFNRNTPYRLDKRSLAIRLENLGAAGRNIDVEIRAMEAINKAEKDTPCQN